MMSFNRPPQPPDFGRTVASDADKVRLAIESGAKPKFNDRWSSYKAAFSEAQYQKCAYCERDCIAIVDGDVEHFAPKAEVHRFDVNSPGKEQKYLSRVRGRKTPTISDRGYWWLAYEWNNYVLACNHCNRKWKRNLFPIGNSPRSIPPNELIRETTLLINPFDEPDASRYFEYTYFGALQPPQDVRAIETIRTCGLDRPSLTFRRSRLAMKVFKLTNRVLDRVRIDDPLHVEAADDLLSEGHQQCEHAGMVRSIWRQLSGLEWAKLEEFAHPTP